MSATNFSSLAREVDELHDRKAFKQIYELLDGQKQAFENNADILWRFARAHFDMAEERPEDKEYRKDFLDRGLAVAKRALDLDPNNSATHKWYAILLSTLGDYLGTKEKIGNAFKIKEHLLKSIELKPDDATTQHVLGVWCFKVASIGWVERKIASTLFASPPESSYDEALRYFLRAAELDPQFLRNIVYVAETYERLKQPNKAREWYQKALEIPVVSDNDRALNQDAKKRLSRL